MGQPNYHKIVITAQVSKANVGNWNILVPIGEENKQMIPLVVASERGPAQTTYVAMHRWGSRTTILYFNCEWNVNGTYGHSGW